MKVKDFAKIYFAILLAHLVAIDVGESPMLERFTKPLLLFSLIAWFYSRTPNRSRGEKLFLSGLFFSWVGDILLMFADKDELYFMLGLGAFLIAQINYTLVFLADARQQRGLLQSRPWLALPVLAYGVFFVWMLRSGLGNLVLPVTLYATILMAMLLAAIHRSSCVNARSASLVLVGALLFVLSDSFLAYAKFIEEFTYHRILVMSTYGVAQYALAWGFLQSSRALAD